MTTATKTSPRTISQILSILLVLLILAIAINKINKKVNDDCNDEIENGCNSIICPEHYFGPTANPDDCASFYMCLGGASKLMLYCPKLHYFSIDTNQCEPADRVDCGDRPSRMTSSPEIMTMI